MGHIEVSAQYFKVPYLLGTYNNCLHFVDVNAMKEISSSEVDELIVDGIILVTEK